MITKQQLIDQGLDLIPVSEIDIKLDPNERIGYDFTVEDYYTFSTDDGVFVQDCMAIYFPITEKSQKDVKDKLGIWNNLVSQTDLKLVPLPGHDIILGIYTLSKDDNWNKDNLRETRNGVFLPKGKSILNDCFPQNYPIIKTILTGKNLIKHLNNIALQYSPNEVMTVLDNIKTKGFEAATTNGYTLSIDDLYSKDLMKIANQLTGNVKEDMIKMSSKEVMGLLKQFSFVDYIESGARGSWDQVKQLVLSRGYVADANNKIRPELIRNNLVRGLTQREFFDSCWGARKGLLDIALSTGNSGYLTRQLIYSSSFIELNEQLDDCETTEYLEMEVENKLLAKTLLWRYYLDDQNKLQKITVLNYKSLIGKTIKLRSPVYCASKKICKKCYGDLHKILHSNQIGIIATQAIGEPCTQLVLRTFHNSGVAQSGNEQFDEQEDIITGMKIANQIFHKPYKLKKLNSNEYVKTPIDLIKIIYSIFNEYRNIHMVHYEILISAMMWYNETLWRLTEDRNNKEFEWVSILKIPSKSSWLIGCAFSNVKSKLLDGLINYRIDDESSLSNLFKF